MGAVSPLYPHLTATQSHIRIYTTSDYDYCSYFFLFIVLSSNNTTRHSARVVNGYDSNTSFGYHMASAAQVRILSVSAVPLFFGLISFFSSTFFPYIFSFILFLTCYRLYCFCVLKNSFLCNPDLSFKVSHSLPLRNKTFPEMFFYNVPHGRVDHTGELTTFAKPSPKLLLYPNVTTATALSAL